VDCGLLSTVTVPRDGHVGVGGCFVWLLGGSGMVMEMWIYWLIGRLIVDLGVDVQWGWLDGAVSILRETLAVY
jgi:hypothetical protein